LPDDFHRKPFASEFFRGPVAENDVKNEKDKECMHYVLHW